MNLRQKAKRFKKLYEEIIPKKPYPVVYKTTLPKHYRIQKSIDARDLYNSQDNLQLLKTIIANGILQELRPLIVNNLKVERERGEYFDIYRYSLDIWMEREE